MTNLNGEVNMNEERLQTREKPNTQTDSNGILAREEQLKRIRKTHGKEFCRRNQSEVVEHRAIEDIDSDAVYFAVLNQNSWADNDVHAKP
jgi:hypothetical protein